MISAQFRTIRRFGMTLLAIAISLGTVSMHAQSAESPNGLTGTWHVQVTLHNCATGVQIGPAFQSILSFQRGGTMSGTTTNPAFQVGQRTPDFGKWSQDSGQNYAAVSEAYVLFTGGPFVRGTQRLTQAIHVDGDTFDSVASVQFFDASLNLVTAGCANATGTRF
jgi:hypothetical protein